MDAHARVNVYPEVDIDRSVLLEIVRMFLEHGVNPNVTDRRDTVLLHHFSFSAIGGCFFVGTSYDARPI